MKNATSVKSCLEVAIISHTVGSISYSHVISAMGKPQIAIRISPSLLQELNNYVELTGMSKTDVVVSAISQYLGCEKSVPLNQRMGELEKRLTELETKLNII